MTFNAGKSQASNLKEGPARLVVEAVSNDFAGHTDSAAFDVTVALEPPRVAADGERHYINQGGAELVVLTPGGLADLSSLIPAFTRLRRSR